MSRSDADFKFKLVIVGDASVGKSSLIRRFGSSEFPEALNSTIGVDFIVKNLSLDGYTAKLQIWDTAGQERFRTIITGYYRGADGIIFVFDKSKRETFDHIDEWVLEVSQYSTEKAVKILVGNKADAVSQISKEEAKLKADKLGYNYIEASAKSDLNVSSIFYTITRSLIDRNKELGIIPLYNANIALKNDQNAKKSFCC